MVLSAVQDNMVADKEVKAEWVARDLMEIMLLNMEALKVMECMIRVAEQATTIRVRDNITNREDHIIPDLLKVDMLKVTKDAVDIISLTREIKA